MTIPATALQADDWRCVRIITVSLNFGGRPITADVIYERAITENYKVDSQQKDDFGFKRCICEKDVFDNFIFNAISRVFNIESEMQEIVMFNIEREEINKYKSSYVASTFSIRLVPVLDIHKLNSNNDVFQIDLPLFIHADPNDIIAIPLMQNKVCSLPYALVDFVKISQFAFNLQNQLK